MAGLLERRYSRRRLLGATAAAGLGATALALVGCGDDDDQDAPAAAVSEQAQADEPQAQPAATQEQQDAPQQQAAAQQQEQAVAQQAQQQTQQAASGAGEAVIRLAAIGGSQPLPDPRWVDSILVYHVISLVFDYVALHGENGLIPGLAESMTPNEDATVWTIRLREGARFHDGRPVRAQDLDYSIRFFGDPETSPVYANQWTDVDYDNMRPLDELTLEIPLLRPRADYIDASFAIYALVLPEGLTDFSQPIGSGPYRLVSNDGADGYELVRNEDWWGPRPSVDRVVTVPIADPTARINALKSGEVNFAYDLTPTIAITEAENEAVVVHRSDAGSYALGFMMNVTLPPFDDPRVREAVRLAVDREGLVNSVLLGQGSLGNDLVGKGMAGYHDGLPQRTRDLERATQLFAEAGITELDVVAADISSGLVAASELLAAQLAEAGVTLRIEELPADSFFDDFARLLTTPFQAMFFVNRPPAVHLPAFAGSNAVFNVSGFATPEFDAALTASQAVVDSAERDGLIREAQEILWRDGGDIFWGYRQMIVAYDPSISNVQFSNDGIVQFQSVAIAT